MKIAVIGLSITSSWGNGHATTYRGLLREMARRGHDVTFLEWDAPWYAGNRDMPDPQFCRTVLYKDVDELFTRHADDVHTADACIVGSYVRNGIAVGEWVTSHCRGVTAFYDIDTPVTLAAIANGSNDYISTNLIPAYDVYLSFTGGPTLSKLERVYGSPAARPLYCSFDENIYFPEEHLKNWDLGYMGTYSDDRQPTVNELLIEPTRRSPDMRAVIAGPKYPDTLDLPPNVERIEHLPPDRHRKFYNAQSFTLNVTRADMIAAGYSPSVRLFEAAACSVPIISDYWDGLDSLFALGDEILIAETSEDVLRHLRDKSSERRREIGAAARARVMREHTAAQRAAELERYLIEAGQTTGKFVARKENAISTARHSYLSATQ
jgi:spore maturation protein CgeB